MTVSDTMRDDVKADLRRAAKAVEAEERRLRSERVMRPLSFYKARKAREDLWLHTYLPDIPPRQPTKGDTDLDALGIEGHDPVIVGDDAPANREKKKRPYDDDTTANREKRKRPYDDNAPANQPRKKKETILPKPIAHDNTKSDSTDHVTVPSLQRQGQAGGHGGGSKLERSL